MKIGTLVHYDDSFLEQKGIGILLSYSTVGDSIHMRHVSSADSHDVICKVLLENGFVDNFFMNDLTPIN